MKKKKMKFFSKAMIYVGILLVIFVATVLGTKYYLYDSDYAVKQTDLSMVSVDGIKLGMHINDVDISVYTSTDEVVDKCNYNFEELSLKTNSKGVIVYITADSKKVDIELGEETSEKISKINQVWIELGSNYKNETYKPEENNYWKISKYVDADNKIYLGVVYSRYNNEMTRIVLSDERIKD